MTTMTGQRHTITDLARVRLGRMLCALPGTGHGPLPPAPARRAVTGGAALVLRWSFALAIAPTLLAGCGAGGALPAAAPAPAAPTLRSVATGQTEAGTPVAIPAPAAGTQVVSARPLTGDVGPTGNVTVSMEFASQPEPQDSPLPRVRLQLVTE